MKNNKNLVVSIENTQTNLLLVKNYKNTIDCSVDDVISKFSTIMLDYIIVTSEKLNIKNNTYFQYIFERGLETIIHVFQIIFYYTKNIELTYQQCQKAYLYYIEFIEQISDENVSFLQLSSKDAVLFVYKKTIYDLNSEYIKNISFPNEEQHKFILSVNTYISIYKSIILFLLKKIENTTKTDKTDKIINLNLNRGHKINSIHNFVTNITTLFKKYKINTEITELLYLFVSVLIDKYDDDISIFYSLIEEFIKKQNKLSSDQIDIDKIKKNIHNSSIKTYIENKQYQKIIHHILEL
jgi:hypothetical protein